MLGHGWAYQKLANQQSYLPSWLMAAILAVIGCQSRSYTRFVETKAVYRAQLLKGLPLPPYYLSSLINGIKCQKFLYDWPYIQAFRILHTQDL